MGKRIWRARPLPRLLLLPAGEAAPVLPASELDCPDGALAPSACCRTRGNICLTEVRRLKRWKSMCVIAPQT